MNDTSRSGSVATTTIRICHHQAYNVGGIVPIRYDRKAPSDAAERDMLPNPNLGLPAAVLLLGTLAAAVVARRRRSQPTLRDDDTPEIEAKPADDESMEPVLVGADA